MLCDSFVFRVQLGGQGTTQLHLNSKRQMVLWLDCCDSSLLRRQRTRNGQQPHLAGKSRLYKHRTCIVDESNTYFANSTLFSHGCDLRVYQALSLICIVSHSTLCKTLHCVVNAIKAGHCTVYISANLSMTLEASCAPSMHCCPLDQGGTCPVLLALQVSCPSSLAVRHVKHHRLTYL
jgi:hypothetical protein